MAPKKAEHRVQVLLTETILALCRTSLNFKREITIEGLLGITLDDEEVVLVNINKNAGKDETEKKSSILRWESAVADSSIEEPFLTMENTLNAVTAELGSSSKLAPGRPIDPYMNSYRNNNGTNQPTENRLPMDLTMDTSSDNVTMEDSLSFKDSAYTDAIDLSSFKKKTSQQSLLKPAQNMSRKSSPKTGSSRRKPNSVMRQREEFLVKNEPVDGFIEGENYHNAGHSLLDSSPEPSTLSSAPSAASGSKFGICWPKQRQQKPALKRKRRNMLHRLYEKLQTDGLLTQDLADNVFQSPALQNTEMSHASNQSMDQSKIDTSPAETTNQDAALPMNTPSKIKDEKSFLSDQSTPVDSNSQSTTPTHAPPSSNNQSSPSTQVPLISYAALQETLAKVKEEGGSTCPLCGKEFTCFRSVQRHMLIHTGEKPFKCHICGRAFNQSAHVKMHMFKHTRQGPQCKHCHETFRDTYKLKIHRCVAKTMTSDSPVQPEMFGDLSTDQFSIASLGESMGLQLFPEASVNQGEESTVQPANESQISANQDMDPQKLALSKDNNNTKVEDRELQRLNAGGKDMDVSDAPQPVIHLQDEEIK